MAKDVNKLLKGVSDCILAAVDDAGAASPAQVGDSFPLLSLDYLDENSIQSETKKLTQKEGGGNLLQLGDIATVNINSLSGSQNAIDAAKKFKNAQCNIYGFGTQQSHKLTKFLMNVETPTDLKKGGKSVIACSTEKKISPDETIGTLGSAPAAFAADAAYKFNEIQKKIRQENLVFAIYPQLGNFNNATKIYDASVNRKRLDLFNGLEWTGNSILFDGVNDYARETEASNLSNFDEITIIVWFKRLTSASASQLLSTSTSADWGLYLQLSCESPANNNALKIFYRGANINVGTITDTAEHFAAFAIKAGQTSYGWNWKNTKTAPTTWVGGSDPNAQGAHQLTLGAFGTNSDFYNGHIYMMLIYSRQLTEQEVGAIYDATKADYGY